MTWLTDNPTEINNFYDYKNTKIIRNEAIEQGTWFKMPSGWSLISIDPIIDEDKYGGKLWKDARPFTWGNPGTEEGEREKFDAIYYAALREYLRNNCPDSVIEKFSTDKDKTYMFDESGNEICRINWDLLSNDHLEDFA